MVMKLTKEEKERAAYIWEGVKTGVAKSHHYKVEMIKFYNLTTSCSSCLNTCYEFVKGIVAKPKKKNVKK